MLFYLHHQIKTRTDIFASSFHSEEANIPYKVQIQNCTVTLTCESKHPSLWQFDLFDDSFPCQTDRIVCIEIYTIYSVVTSGTQRHHCAIIICMSHGSVPWWMPLQFIWESTKKMFQEVCDDKYLVAKPVGREQQLVKYIELDLVGDDTGNMGCWCLQSCLCLFSGPLPTQFSGVR